MKRAGWIVLAIVAMAAAGCAKIQPQEGGVRTNFIIAKGISDKSLGPGLYLDIPSVSEVTAYSIREAKYEMTKDPSLGEEQGRDDIQLKSKDGQVVWVDCTVRYRLLKETLPKLHETYGQEYVRNAIRPMTRALVSYKFGELSAEEIYDGKNRELLGVTIRNMMNKGYEDQIGLKEKGVEIIDVLFRSFEFTPEYQNAIESKRLATEQKLAAVELAKKREAEAEGEKLAMIKNAEGLAESMRTQADASLYAQQQEAQGIEAIGAAEASAKSAMSTALGGGDVLVRLEFASKLGENMQVWGIPIGGNSTSFMDLSGLFGGMFPKMDGSSGKSGAASTVTPRAEMAAPAPSGE